MTTEICSTEPRYIFKSLKLGCKSNIYINVNKNVNFLWEFSGGPLSWEVLILNEDAHTHYTLTFKFYRTYLIPNIKISREKLDPYS